MGLDKFSLVLDRPVYYAGQTICGKLIVAVNKPMSMRAIYVKYSGQAIVRWTENHRHNNKNTTVTYRNQENYLELQQLMFGNNNDNNELATGEHIFIFQCTLPVNVPSSFEGHFGRVRYSIKATIDRPWKSDHVVKVPLTVISVFDLNQNPIATVPISEQSSKTFWGHSKTPLYMTVSLPVRGYVPGQVIPIKVFLNNESTVQIKSIYISLKQNSIYHAVSKSRTSKMSIIRNEFPVAVGFGKEELHLNIPLPALPPSYLTYCRIIDINYQLNVTAKAKTWYHRDHKIPTEIIVGNIPLMTYQMPISGYRIDPNAPQPEQAHQDEMSPPSYGFVNPSEWGYNDLPPPTYEQSMQYGKSAGDDAENEADSDGEVSEFSPLYPVYKFKPNE